MQNIEAEFIYNGTTYKIRIVGCSIFPQGYAAVLDKIPEMRGVNILADIGNGTIPAAATINAPVVIIIGGGAVQYPLTNKNCTQVTTCGIRTRTRYSTCVQTTPTGGTFRLLGRACCAPNNNLTAIDGTAPAAEA